MSPKQFQIFSFSALKGWPAAEVKRALGVSAAQVYLARHRVAALLRREVRKLEVRR